MSKSPFLAPVYKDFNRINQMPKFIDNTYKQRLMTQKQKKLMAEQDNILSMHELIKMDE